MKSLTIIFVTSRELPSIHWMLDSLNPQIKGDDHIEVIVVDSFWVGQSWESSLSISSLRVRRVVPKPTVWQGAHRLTKEDWWAASNARNTGICLCKTEWIAFLDDRCVLGPLWLDCIRDAMVSQYAVCGAYEKRHGMKVENGVIIEPGTVTGEDCRLKQAHGHPMPAPGQWFFGCTTALPLEWELKVGGYEEFMDGQGFEDVIHGMHLANANVPIKYDPRMKVIQDRTPEFSGPVMKKTDKGISPNDKSHASLKKFGTQNHTTYPFNIRDIRERVLKGEPFPGVEGLPTTDWYDGQKICEM